MNQQSWRPFLMISLALCIGTIGTALASPLYPIYQQLWHLLPSQITYIFVAYMFGCLTTLLFLGRTSNSFGFIRTLQIGLFFAIIGLTFSVFASNTYLLGFGRFTIGIASGLISTSAMLGLIYTIPDSHKQNAAQLSSIITVMGFGLGPLIGGTIAQYSDQPLITPYLPVIFAAILSLISLFTLKTASFEKLPFSIAPHLERPEPQFKTLFYIASFSAFCAFGSFSLFASLAPSFIKDVIPWHSPLVSGATIASILLISASVQWFAKSLDMHKTLNVGLIFLIVSYVILSICITMHWSMLFFFSVICVGIGHGLNLLGAFAFIHHMTNIENRAAVVSTYLFIAYFGTIIPIITAGYLSDHFGFMVGILGFCLGVGILCIYLLIKHLNIKHS
ncbi:MFS transporter [Acinetobacter rongchengensis]|uniref:MFS transporter n=1 Tax=Acinetobacter rongchengensis TaxID=2419601 RepID=A0A3A8F647_9GAMM|nr:MFS transporter [Acinetobacter rongchengensis]RKG36631.1 MFS transporter [Acinetobacter rongchengensis]